MSISAPFIRHPVATSLLALAILLVGVFCYTQLPVAPLPQVDFPTIQVNANLPGASPETMASNVASPLERQFSNIPGLTQMTSSSAVGTTSIALQFELSRSIDAAAQDVQAAINAAAGQLPSNLPAPPTLRKTNPADSPLVIFALQSQTLPLSTVSDFADNLVVPRLSRIDGVGSVSVVGSSKPAVRIQIDPRRAAALGLHLETIRAAIAANTVNAPKGQLTGAHQNAAIYANDQLPDADQWNELIVAYHNGAPVRLRDVGRAFASVENSQTRLYAAAGHSVGSPIGFRSGSALMVFTTKQPGANVIRTAEAIKALVPELRAALPASIELHLIEDKTQTIRASVHDVQLTLLVTVALVVGVIFVFLRNARATLVPSAVIPLALMASAAFMLPFGFSLDNLSLMALTIAVGFVVDDAIVVVEAIWRRIEHGEPPLQAAYAGAAEVGFTVLSISLSLIAVFTPVMFMGGVVGRFMREFALTLSAAVAVSVILSLTLTPMLCGRFLQPPRASTHGLLHRLEQGFTALQAAYARGLDLVMRHPRTTLAAFLATAALSLLLYLTSSTGFFPQQDTGFIQGTIVLADGSSFEYATGKVKQVIDICVSEPGVAEGHGNISQGSASQAGVILTLAPRNTRVSSDEIIARLRPKLARVVGARTVLQSQQDINIGARISRAQYQYTLSDTDIGELSTWTPQLVTALQALPLLRDVSSDLQTSAPSATLVIDRDAAGRFGISPADIDAAVYDQLGQRQVTQYFTQVNSYHVVLETTPDLQGDPRIFDYLYITSPRTGKPVPLSMFVKVDTSQTRSLSVNHQGQSPAATISFNLAPGASLGAAVAAIQATRARLGAPPSLSGSFQGTAAAFQESLSSMPLLILAALVAVYIVLGVLYESYVHPLTILSTLPSAGVGALLALRLVGQDLNVIGIVAIILLIGIVKKNGIMIVDVALKLETEHGLSPQAAVVEASHRRLRPILMTTACAFFAGLPMVVMSGTGSEFRQPLGWAIVGGLLVSQALTLFTTPVVYLYLDRFRRAPARVRATA